ncbi:hypothetical protein ALC53_10356 [Atta colombica]|uniref:Uncharacterized protein n=1 Tax=Atta colombica TaxID=520822 RepID=A0A195B4K1_9HYME|nr:hypothetical protein ALC53_10356 [Atta colombica]
MSTITFETSVNFSVVYMIYDIVSKVSCDVHTQRYVHGKRILGEEPLAKMSAAVENGVDASKPRGGVFSRAFAKRAQPYEEGESDDSSLVTLGQVVLLSKATEKVALSIASPFPKDDQSATEQYPAEREFPLDVSRRNRPIIPAFEFRSPAHISVSMRQKREFVERGTSTTEGVYPREKEKAVVRAGWVAGHIEKARRDEAYELGIMSP